MFDVRCFLHQSNRPECLPYTPSSPALVSPTVPCYKASMKTGYLFVAAAALGLLLSTGCQTIPEDKDAVLLPPTPMYPDGELTAQQSPLPIAKERVDPDLNPHVWVDGSWVKSGDTWVWVPAHVE